MKVGRAILLCCALAASSMPASAQNPDANARARALDLSKKSLDAYRERRFEEAVSMLLEARRLTREPILLYNLGRAYEALGELEHALSAYEDYLREAPKAPDRETTERRVEALKREIAERKAAPPPTAQPTTTVIGPPPLPPTPPIVTRSPSATPLVVTGVGLATFATGAVFGLFAKGAESDARDEPTAEGATAKHGDAETFALVANVCFIAGGALTAAGVVWTIVDRGSTPTSRASLFLSPSGAGGTF